MMVRRARTPTRGKQDSVGKIRKIKSRKRRSKRHKKFDKTATVTTDRVGSPVPSETDPVEPQEYTIGTDAKAAVGSVISDIFDVSAEQAMDYRRVNPSRDPPVNGALETMVFIMRQKLNSKRKRNAAMAAEATTLTDAAGTSWDPSNGKELQRPDRNLF